MREPKAFTRVEVEWEDAITKASDQHDSPAAALRSYRPYYRKSVGIWLGWAEREGREAAALATDDDRREDDPQAVGGISFIPRGMVVRVEPIAHPPVRKRRRRT